MTRWQMFSAVALRRLPEVIPRKDPIELRIQQIFSAYEDAKSRLSKHELQHLQDVKLKESQDADVVITETAQDREDRWIKAKSGFTYVDFDNRLTKTQYLFAKIKFNTDIKDQWLLPQASFDRGLGDENLPDTARRALKETLNIINGYRIISRIPSSVYSFRYSKKIAHLTGYDGAKVFFLKANLDLPSRSVLEAIDSSKNDRLKWVTHDEASQIVGKSYMSGFRQGLLSEDRVDVDKVLKKASKYAKTIKQVDSCRAC